MPRIKARWSEWRGICLIAITYTYFLIFAQFAFLKRLALLGIANEHLKAVMAAMALGGILLSMVAPRIEFFPSPDRRLRIGLGACGAAAALSLLPLGFAASIAVSFLIGCGLGLLTVTLVTYLRQWLGSGNLLLKVGFGTGIGYLVCNFPPLFTASPEIQSAISAVICLVGIFIAFASSDSASAESTTESTVPFIQVLACFTALIWLDSAAFFIIQNTPALKAGTWEGDVHLWVNGLLHLSAALASVWLLRRRGLPSVLTLAFLALACACLLLADPSRALVASAFYPVGVSLYSVALVAWPSLIAPAASEAQRGRQVGWIYAIAGWVGSAMGIGMGQNLGQVSPAFVLVAGAVILLPAIRVMLRQRRREVGAVAVVLTAALCIDRTIVANRAPSPQLSPVERGRVVYISEGCISCHSQYVRPNTPDTLLWGPVQSVEELHRERPPLIGNRRQGPDLAEVGRRRSPLWLKAHLIDPSEVSHGSFMPSYAWLFRDRRGDDLVSYLGSLQGAGIDRHLLAEKTWFLSNAATAGANSSDGEQFFHLYCATCHTSAGPTLNRWRTSFDRWPPNLVAGPFLHLAASDSLAERRERIARTIKFGIHGTDMPGHEYLPDREIASVSLWLAQGMAQL